jgi:M6 family metalloprotease-like protein
LPVLVVLAQFPDRALGRPRAEFTGRPDALVDRFVAYWTEVSSGRLQLRVHVGGPVVTLPEARARYVQRPHALARDALRAFTAVATEASDREALARGGALVVFFAGSGREANARGGSPDDPWSNYTALTPPEGNFSEAIVVAEREEVRTAEGTLEALSPFGVLVHEFGHLLGLPELYAPSGRTHEGIGVGPDGTGDMGGGRPSAASRGVVEAVQLGWADAETIERTRRGVAPARSRKSLAWCASRSTRRAPTNTTCSSTAAGSARMRGCRARGCWSGTWTSGGKASGTRRSTPSTSSCI